MAEPTGAVPIGIFHSANPTRIRTLRCAENPPWCPVAPSIQRHQRGFAPFDAQNTTLVPISTVQTPTSTRIRTHRCAEHHSGIRSQIPLVDINEDLHLSMRRTPLWCPIAYFHCQRGFAPFDAQNATLVADRKFLSSTSTRIRTHRCAERHSGARPHLPWNIFPRHPGSWVALFRPA